MTTLQKAMASVLEIPGYECITTFWSDFSIADCYGSRAVLDTYQNAFENWKEDYKYMTELVLVLNHKIWQHYYKQNERLARLYDSIWKQADSYCLENFKGDALSYYFEVTD